MKTDLLLRLLDVFVDVGYRVQHKTTGLYGCVNLLEPDAAAENGFFYELTDVGRQRVVDDLLDHYAYTDAVASFLIEPIAAIGPGGVRSVLPEVAHHAG